ncbi:MAG: cytidine deaminase [Candidatus Krumholzibacteria bacterium]|jgi:cytidine deaminase|nr:cytidine deaminase [Candidatus Krumholzibacteria bacterium]MDP6668993.1 cytidine deaminase [Candidatus Krumholzibacteria bacterium]MDP6797063.1 cytidine deaminase [Candidatus Krumholzibacteria bacterium]MDP7021083.1 cytidine deaminase [Candidatus Krumholzibacteria bacterium]
MDKLLEKALEAREMAYAPYSGFRVGAALETESGEIFSAANLENASLGLSVCAERNAVARAVHSGQRRFTRIAISSDAPFGVPPCGACRQVLQEFAEDLEILLIDEDGSARSYRLKELLPAPFTPEQLREAGE